MFGAGCVPAPIAETKSDQLVGCLCPEDRCRQIGPCLAVEHGTYAGKIGAKCVRAVLELEFVVLLRQGVIDVIEELALDVLRQPCCVALAAFQLSFLARFSTSECGQID